MLKHTAHLKVSMMAKAGESDSASNPLPHTLFPDLQGRVRHAGCPEARGSTWAEHHGPSAAGTPDRGAHTSASAGKLRFTWVSGLDK